MGILSRAADILSANINSLLDKAEDPVKMAKKYLGDYMEDLAECKKDTVTIVAQEKAAQRAYDDVKATVSKYEAMAQRAVSAGNDDDARKLIAHKQQAEADLAQKKQILDACHANTVKMTDVYNKLVSNIETLRQRVNNVEASAAVADAHETVASIMDKYGAGYKGADGIARMEAKVQNQLDKAEAAVQLGNGATDEQELEAKYGAGSTGSPSVDAELAAMKAALLGPEG